MFLIGLVLVPLMLGLVGLLVPRVARWGVALSCVYTAGTAAFLLAGNHTVSLHLLDSFGVWLFADASAAWFLLANALVCLAVLWHERNKTDAAFFLLLLVLLHGCLNACFLSHDLFNLFVVIELTTIIAFLLVGSGEKPRHQWNALRYLFLSNVGMLFFLLGTILIYESAGDFKFSSMVHAPATAQALIVTGLLVKGGVCLPGLWLPQAHAECETAVSALLSGLVVKIGLLPLLRIGSYVPDLQGVLMGLGLAGACLGLGLGFFQRDVKRLLACSTLSQVGFILLVPSAGAFYAFTHALAKAGLFLSVSGLPDRDLTTLQAKRIPRAVQWPFRLAALSIAGCPLLAGFGAKAFISQALNGWVLVVVAVAAAGTSALMMRLLLLPGKREALNASSIWHAPVMLCIPLTAIGVYLGPYTVSAWFKAGGTLLAGWLLHSFVLNRLMHVHVPREWEKLEHIVGLTGFVLIILLVIGDFK